MIEHTSIPTENIAYADAVESEKTANRYQMILRTKAYIFNFFFQMDGDMPQCVESIYFVRNVPRRIPNLRTSICL